IATSSLRRRCSGTRSPGTGRTSAASSRGCRRWICCSITARRRCACSVAAWWRRPGSVATIGGGGSPLSAPDPSPHAAVVVRPLHSSPNDLMLTPMLHRVRASLALVLVLLILAPAFAPGAAAQQAPPDLTLEGLFASATFSAEGFDGGRWAAEGPVVTYVVAQEDGSTDLVSYNLETDTQETLLDGARLRAPDTGE